MSFDIFVNCFRHLEPAPLPRQTVEAIFAPYIVGREDIDILVVFEDGGRARVTIFERGGYGSLAVNRPPASPAFWQAIIDVLAATDSVLHWPGTGCVITNPAVGDHLPDDMLAALGKPTVTNTVEGVLDCISRG